MEIAFVCFWLLIFLINIKTLLLFDIKMARICAVPKDRHRIYTCRIPPPPPPPPSPPPVYLLMIYTKHESNVFYDSYTKSWTKHIPCSQSKNIQNIFKRAYSVSVNFYGRISTRDSVFLTVQTLWDSWRTPIHTTDDLLSDSLRHLGNILCSLNTLFSKYKMEYVSPKYMQQRKVLSPSSYNSRASEVLFDKSKVFLSG